MPAQAIPVNILLIGASGYIGGSVLAHLCSRPNNAGLHISALVRNPADSEAIKSSYPQVETVLGDLGDKRLLYDAAAGSDVVIYAARNTQEGVEPLMSGLAGEGKNGIESSEEQCSRNRPALFIMLSAIISLADPKNLRLGEPPLESSKPMSDLEDKDAIMNLPEYHWHVAQERAFIRLAAEKGRGIITPVVMSLPFTVGNGTGPVRTRGFVHEYAKALLDRPGKKPFILGQGLNAWSWSSPRDLAAAVVFVMDWWKGNPNDNDLQGYIYAESGQLEMRKLARYVGQVSDSVSAGQEEEPSTSSDGCESLQYPQFAELMPELPGLWGVSAVCQADKLRSKGWKPMATSWEPLVDEVVRSSCV
ncbi:NAD(P)-binding domain [Colletotrichum tabaci]|uniref:NAD(P)-binding domain n=1 Tax=Colletotrichum tabaci TaxID=1209068 RepID=A0AAV9TYD4_9PEZI